MASLAVSIQYTNTNVTDRQTDGRTRTTAKTALCRASRGKNVCRQYATSSSYSNFFVIFVHIILLFSVCYSLHVAIAVFNIYYAPTPIGRDIMK